MSIDRRTYGHFSFVCEQHLAGIYRYGVDMVGGTYKSDRGVLCDVVSCPLEATFEYYPNLCKRIASRTGNTR